MTSIICILLGFLFIPVNRFEFKKGATLVDDKNGDRCVLQYGKQKCNFLVTKVVPNQAHRQNENDFTITGPKTTAISRSNASHPRKNAICTRPDNIVPVWEEDRAWVAHL